MRLGCRLERHVHAHGRGDEMQGVGVQRQTFDEEATLRLKFRVGITWQWQTGIMQMQGERPH